MKKFTLLFIALAVITSAKADLVVDSLGTVTMDQSIINTATIDSLSSSYITVINPNKGILLRPDGIKSASSYIGFYFDSNNGAFLSSINNNNFHGNRIGNTFSIGSNSNNLFLYNNNQQPNGTTILAAVESNNSSFFVGLNRSINTVSFHVSAAGEVFARSGFVSSSDASLKDNIQSLSNVLDGIRDINPVTYNFKTDIENNNQQSQRNTTNDNNIRVRYGFIAQELEEIFPDVVHTMPSGEKGIAYQELIPILVGAIQEQQEVIDNLADEIEALRQPTTEQRRQAPASVQDALADGSAMLMQNTPNPFNQATEIGYRLPEGAATALIMVCDMNGKMLQTYPLPVNTTAGTLTIQAGSYTPGMYLYTLLVDGAQIDTKQMIILAY